MLSQASQYFYCNSILHDEQKTRLKWAIFDAGQQKRSEKKLRGILANTFGQGASSHWSNSDDDKGEEAFPYVSFSIEI